MERFADCFADLPDPRGPNAMHDLTELLFMALLATLCGATTCCDFALFARTREDLLRSVLTLRYGTPSHDTFSRVFRLLDTTQPTIYSQNLHCIIANGHFERSFQPDDAWWFRDFREWAAMRDVIFGRAIRCEKCEDRTAL